MYGFFLQSPTREVTEYWEHTHIHIHYLVLFSLLQENKWACIQMKKIVKSVPGCLLLGLRGQL